MPTGLLPLTVVVLLGMLAGLGTFTFGYAQGASYLSDRPEACTGCHVMQEPYDTWKSSGHRHVAVCNDCHLPHGVRKWITKADNGFFHSLAFTTGDYPWPLQIKPRNGRVTQQACVGCHARTVHQMLAADGDRAGSLRAAPRCVGCHAAAGHAFHSRRGAGYNR
jgi:cytochrome c nitrite reductase small subunit